MTLHQGQYKPINIDKYKGTYPITYRSSWELCFMLFCDKNPNILSWGSESTVIPYADPTREGTIHRYFIDFTMTIKDKTGQIKKFLVEIKPYKETIPPYKGNKKQKTILYESLTYARNMSKWKCANEHAKKYGYEFIILTERELSGYK